MGFRKPRPKPPKAKPASVTLSFEERALLAKRAEYVGSPHHTDVPKYGIRAAPRRGATAIEKAESNKIKNPDCLVCPRKWARRKKLATETLQKAIIDGSFVSEGPQSLPSPIWGRDPENITIVYEAKLCQPPGGYKAYPITSFQVEHNLPFDLP